jgi:two-component system chemotaxis sensor kinase CheA
MLDLLAAGPQAALSVGRLSAASSSLQQIEGRPLQEIRVQYSYIEELLGMGQEVQTLARTVPILPDDDTLFEIKAWIDHCLALMKDFAQRLTHLRLMPIADFMALFTHAVHQIAKACGKQAKLALSGGDVLADVALLEHLREPLIHLIRNGIAHGIEPPLQRTRAGKPACGEIRVTASAQGERLVLEIGDDGRGIDVEPIRAFLKDRRRVSDKRLARMTAADLLPVICDPDYSSAAHTTDIAGRGVGMHVVAQSLANLGGTLDIYSKPRHGTRFVIRLPLSLSIVSAVIFRNGPYTLALPTSAVTAVKNATEISPRQRQAAIQVVPRRHHRADDGWYFIELNNSISVAAGNSVHGVSGFLAEAILRNRSLMVKPPGNLLSRVGLFAGVGILPDGAVALVLDPARLNRLRNASAAGDFPEPNSVIRPTPTPKEQHCLC